MSQKETMAFLEILVAGVIILVCAALFWDSMSLPESAREPLGSAAIPQVVCAIVALFCAIMIFRSARAVMEERAARADADIAADPEAPPVRRRFDLAIKVFTVAVIYVALMQSRWVPSEILTPLFLGGAILILNEFRREAIIPAVAVALGIGLGTNFLFTDFFFVDLP